jgi:hypothetical protein
MQCTAVNDNKIKHYITEMEVYIKLCDISFSVVTFLFFFFTWRSSSPRRMRCSVRQLSSVPFASVEEIFSVRQKSGLLSVAGRAEILHPSTKQV